MRELKFRGISLDTGKWEYGYGVIQSEHGGIIINKKGNNISQMNAVDSKTIGQFTGLADKSGNEIYEGDWLRVCAGYISVVIYDEKQGCFLSKYSHPEDPEELLLGDLGDEVEVIGNIHVED